MHCILLFLCHPFNFFMKFVIYTKCLIPVFFETLFNTSYCLTNILLIIMYSYFINFSICIFRLLWLFTLTINLHCRDIFMFFKFLTSVIKKYFIDILTSWYWCINFIYIHLTYVMYVIIFFYRESLYTINSICITKLKIIINKFLL